MPDERTLFFKHFNGRKALICLHDQDPHVSPLHVYHRKSSWEEDRCNIQGLDGGFKSLFSMLSWNGMYPIMQFFQQDISIAGRGEVISNNCPIPLQRTILLWVLWSPGTKLRGRTGGRSVKVLWMLDTHQCTHLYFGVSTGGKPHYVLWLGLFSVSLTPVILSRTIFHIV